MPAEMTLIENLREYRKNLRPWGEGIRGFMVHSEMSALPAEADAGEMKANLMLAYRHVEDAIMRLGKVIQAYDGGRSVYDK